MPLSHTCTFRVRHYECDVEGKLRAASYLRYMQEAAFDASAAAGYDLARYESLGCFWLIRETEIEYLQPVSYGESLEVNTWVADFRRVRSRRAYEFRRANNGPLVAVAQTDWAFLDLATGRPVAIPEEMKAAFFPEGVPHTAEARGRFPTPSEPPDGAFQVRRPVEWRDLDAAGHVNNAVYVDYVEQCGLDWAAAQGWSLDRQAALGFAPVTHSHRIAYRQPALAGDDLILSTWVAEVQDRKLVRDTTIQRAREGRLVARARSVQAWVSQQTGTPLPVPQDLAQQAGIPTRTS
jgi:acyl-CoA thioester hydrolase